MCVKMHRGGSCLHEDGIIITVHYLPSCFACISMSPGKKMCSPFLVTFFTGPFFCYQPSVIAKND